jgi:hypothetical protein
MPVILALRKLRQEDCKFKASLRSKVKPCLKKKKNNKKKHIGKITTLSHLVQSVPHSIFSSTDPEHTLTVLVD